ncbi:MAG: exosome complex protein Rrp4 [Nanoarchaeota archaeon]|nr:exosome complex protein Rrp4 [Nanoarchaeota archaeon]
MTEEEKRKVVIPGEVIAKGDDYLPGEGTEKREKEIVAIKYGLIEEQDRLIKVIPLSGVYIPRRGNVVIGTVENITYYGWVMNIGASENAFIPVSEFPKYIDNEDLEEVISIGEVVVAKVLGITKRGIDLTMKSSGLGRVEEGIIIKINSNKVPRVIGKGGSMINLIKTETNTNITVGQNGIIWIKGSKIEEELLAKKAIVFVSEKSYIHGLTDKLKEWIEEQKKK